MTGPGVDLYWLPLGAGGHSVRLNGRIYEAVAARLERRRPCDLYHAALEVQVPEGRFVIEQAPVRDGNGAERGVVAEGAVGSRWAGRFRIFRYEVRRWRDGTIPDVAEAVASPQRLTNDPEVAQRVLDLAPLIPTPVWGRDELRAGEMWNSNSVIAWLLAAAGLVAESIQPPARGRAPGWRAGIVAARRGKAANRFRPDPDGARPRGDDDVGDKEEHMGTVKALRFPLDARWIDGRLVQIEAVGKPRVAVATPPEFKHGIPGVWSPEELLVGAVAACYELTLVAIAERRGLPLHSLAVEAAGHLEHAPWGGYAFTVIELDVALTSAPGFEAEAAELARLAEKHCIVGRALEIPVHVRVHVREPETALARAAS